MISALPLTEAERAPQKSVAEAADALKAGIRRKTTEFYNRPIPEGTKAVMHRIMGEKPD